MYHSPHEKQHFCLESLYVLYLGKVADIADSVGAVRVKRNGSFGYEKSALGLNKFNNILAESLCMKAGLPRKTSHCLRITSATRLFQNSVEEKLARERTGHSSNALLKYQKPSEVQLELASKVLGPCVTKSSGDAAVSNFQPKQTNEEDWRGTHFSTGTLESSFDSFMDRFEDFDFDVHDEILANISLPTNAGSSAANTNFLTLS